MRNVALAFFGPPPIQLRKVLDGAIDLLVRPFLKGPAVVRGDYEENVHYPAKDAARYGGRNLRDTASAESYLRCGVGIIFEPFVWLYVARFGFHSFFSFNA